MMLSCKSCKNYKKCKFVKVNPNECIHYEKDEKDKK